MSRPRYISGWKLEHSCVKCDLPMSYDTMMYSHGVCPYCANDSGSTIVNCNRDYYRLWTDGPWWKFGTDCIRVYKGERPEDELV